MTSNPWPNEVVESVARAMAQAHGDMLSFSSSLAAYNAGAGSAVEYWNTLALASLNASPLREVVEALTEAVGAIDQCIQVFERDPVTLGGMAAIHLMKGAQVKYRAALAKVKPLPHTEKDHT